MKQQMVRRFLFLLPVFLLTGILMAGCSTEEQVSSEQNTALSTTGTGLLPSTEPITAGTVTSSPTSGSGDSVEKLIPTKKPSAPVTESAKASQKPPVSSDTPSSTPDPVDQKRSTTGDSPKISPTKTPAPAKPSARVSDKPSPTVKPTASPSVTPDDSSEKKNTATISIAGDRATGVILAATVVEVQDGDSVMDILKRITRKQKIQMEFKGAGSFSYVEGINNLYEHDKGAESGWMYRVNGEFPDEGAGSYNVYPGDLIEWMYTLDLGKDVGAKVP
ncbi:MAG: DUF4430 domain-containing protein [Paenibacillus sp.]|nr:DUF4430 domain-containing protein [Paenibacillus sp.]